MAPYADAISKATDDIIPAADRETFAQAYSEALAAEAALKTAEKNALDAQRARAAQDAAWLKGYEAYHRAVEYIAAGDRGVIATWIKEWPES